MRSDNAFVILDRIRSTLNLLKKSNLLYSTTSAALAVPPAQPQLRISNERESSSSISNPPRENPILSSFKELQTKIRFSSISDTIDPYDAVAPFLLIIRAKNMAGPFKLAALEAISCFINSGVIVAAGRQKQAIQEIIDAVTKCKFIQTDFAGDELVQLYLVRTLHQLVTAREPSAGNKVCARDYLSDDDFSAILDFCLTVMMNSGGFKRTLILHQEAELTVGEIARFLTCRLSLSLSMPLGAEDRGTSSTALCRTVEYFIAVLRAAAHDQPLQRGLGSGSGSAQGESNTTPTASHKSTQPPPLGLGLGDGSLDADTSHLIFALKSLQALVTCWSDLAAAQKLLTGLPRLYYLLCDDLGNALLSLSCKRDKFPPLVLQLSLTLFSALYAVCAPGMRVLLECFMKQIYIKALHQAVEIFMAQLESLLDHHDLSSASSSSSSSSPPSSAALPSASAPSPLKHEELEVVFESLCDLLADDGFLPALFASFDCDPTRSDLVQPMIQYLSQCARIVLNSASEELGPNRELGVLVVQAYKQVMSSFLHRLSLSESASVGGAVDLTDLQRLFVSSRHAKYLLQEAARRFEGKSSDGLRYLQQVGALRSPLTARAVARFLRIAPDLSKEAVGAFLGELGKDQPKYESEGKDFHQQVLKEYVQSFSLSGQGVLTCMRVFLSAFRLPGEAQQIDRILVAFSEHCHSSCLEGRSGLLENPEVTYLLTFSIIMLNTDRHNPNIRSDRRMTLEQFIRNNTNYGRDVNQTQPLPRAFLETIYASISEHQIRTEQHGLGAALTQEMWMEMQLSARRDSRKALLITLDSDDFALGQLRAMLQGEERKGKEGEHEEDKGEAAVDAAQNAPESREQGWSSSLIARQLLDPQEGHLEGQSDAGWELLHDPLTLALRLRNLTWLLDQDMLRCVWKDLLLVCISVHMSNFRVVRGAINAAGIPIALPGSGSMSPAIAVANSSGQDPNRKLKSWQRERTGRALQLSNEFISDLLRLSSTYQLRTVQDTVWLLFAEFTGMTQQKPQNNIAEKLFDLLDFFPMEAALSNAPGGGEAAPASASTPQLLMPSLLREDCEEELLVSSSLFERPSAFLQQLSRHPSAQLALVHWTNLLLRQQPQPVLAESDYSSNLWVRLGFLRDCGLLPSQMVLYAEAEVGAGEILPSTVRAQFDSALRQRDRARKRLLRPKATLPKPAIRSAPASFLSLQGLGEALFGSGQGEPNPVPRRQRRKKLSQSSRSRGKDILSSADEESDEEDDDDDEEDGEEDEEGEETGSGGDEQRANISRVISGSRDEIANFRSPNRRDSLPYESPLSRHNLPSARWDLGYENLELLSSFDSDQSSSPSSSGGSTRGLDPAAGRKSIARANKILALKTVRDTRQMLLESGLGQLVSDSRFMEEPALQQFLVGLIAAVESDWRGDFDFQVNPDSTASPATPAAPPSGLTLSCGEVAAAAVDKLTQQLCRHRRPALSAAAVSWLEILLVDVALRNRDRFSVVWPLLRDHYKRTLFGAGDGGGVSIKLSYITERRVIGLLRVSTRMISREHYAKDILQLLGEIFAKNLSPAKSEVPLEDGDAVQEPELKSAAEQDGDSLVKKPVPESALPLAELSNQLSAGVWALLTLNVDLLPSLPLEQWQTLFAIIAECSASDQSYAAVKAFEIMAWLLHEPRLLAKVPVFCIIGVRPLLTNQLAPLTVSVGAASLLLHLHSRLEVLIKENSCGDASPAASSHDDGNLADSEELEADTPILWESCWLPILRLLAEGASDSRREVRSACVGALFAAVQDRHIFAVPSGVLVQVLGDILSPAITLLGTFANSEEPSAATAVATATGPNLVEVMDDDWTRVSVEKQNHQPSVTGAEELPATASAVLLCERGVTVLCELLLRFTPRLVRYPSFDKLWLRVLFVLGSLLGPIDTVTDSINHSDSPTEVGSGGNELSPLGRVAAERLRESVAGLLAAGVFRKREGLGRVTCDSLRMYQGGAAVTAEFGSAMNEAGE